MEHKPALGTTKIMPLKDFNVSIPSHEQGKGVEIEIKKGVEIEIPKILLENMKTEGVI